jgi:hypothetical protein
LDENRRWTIVAEVSRPPNIHPEISANFLKPVHTVVPIGEGGWENKKPLESTEVGNILGFNGSKLSQCDL